MIGSPEQQSLRSHTFRPNDALVPSLFQLFRDDPDPGLHSAAQWTLQCYQKEAEIARINGELRSVAPVGERRWYVNELGHTMVIVPGWTSFLMGAAADDPDRTADERPHTQQIRRSFCIASHETTVDQFTIFLRETGHLRAAPSASEGASASEPLRDSMSRQDGGVLPRADVSWFDAAAYCNWLSSKDGLPPDQRCYLRNQQGDFGPGMRVADDFLERKGYRLPTEAEWEFACRAGATTARYFGDDPTWLDKYAAFSLSGQVGLQQVCRRKPNDFGLFDMLGNVAEWCQDDYRSFAEPETRTTDRSGLVPSDVPRVVRGGSAADPPSRIRSAARDKSLPGTQTGTIGFRVARSNL